MGNGVKLSRLETERNRREIEKMAGVFQI